MMDRDELAAWLRLLRTRGLGRESARRLLATFASPQAVFDAPPAAVREVVTSAIAKAIANPPEDSDSHLETMLSWLHESDSPRAFIALGDPHYPTNLLNTADPPLALFAQGRIEWLQRESIAIVGSRNATAQGIANAHAFAQHLSEGGISIVSGLARGIDAAAHEGALSGSSGTLAVVGTGLDIVYPAQHVELARRIAEKGILLSEFPLGTPPLAAHFPMRNRIIAGLSRGTLVVEAALRSGSLITARLAIEAGREVFAIPGSIHSPHARGCHALIKQGAKLVENGADILEELRPGSTSEVSRDESHVDDATGDVVLDALGFDPVTIDALAARTGWEPAQLSVRLLDLELEGRVARLPGQLFQRQSRS